MTIEHPPVVAEQLEAEPVAAGPAVVARRGGGSAHLGQGGRGEHPVVAVEQERGEPAQVLRAVTSTSGQVQMNRSGAAVFASRSAPPRRVNALRV